LGDLDGLREEIKGMCFASKHYSPSVFTHSINVGNKSVILAEMFGGDIDLVQPMGISHDAGAIVFGRSGENGEGHNVTGARMIAPILQRHKYSLLEIVQIQYGIIVHRGSDWNIIRKTLESRILASADAWDHLGNMQELWNVGQRDLHKSPEDTYAWLLRKLQNDWNKVMPEAKYLLLPDRDCAQDMLERLYAGIPVS